MNSLPTRSATESAAREIHVALLIVELSDSEHCRTCSIDANLPELLACTVHVLPAPLSSRTSGVRARRRRSAGCIDRGDGFALRHGNDGHDWRGMLRWRSARRLLSDLPGGWGRRGCRKRPRARHFRFSPARRTNHCATCDAGARARHRTTQILRRLTRPVARPARAAASRTHDRCAPCGARNGGLLEPDFRSFAAVEAAFSRRARRTRGSAVAADPRQLDGRCRDTIG